MVARRARSALSSAAALVLLLLPGGIHAAAGGAPTEAGGAPTEAASIEELAAAAPDGFELLEVSVVTGKDADGAEQLVSAKYLGPGTRNEIRYMTFASEEAAESFLRDLERDSCSVRTLAMCATRWARHVVAGLSAAACPHPTGGEPERASTLRDFGLAQLRGSSVAL